MSYFPDEQGRVSQKTSTGSNVDALLTTESLDELRNSVTHFVKNIYLKNIKSIARKGMVFKNLLGGYSAALSAGIAIYYSLEEPETARPETLDCISSGETEEERLKFFHPICAKYRACQAQDSKCIAFDKTIAMKYYRGNWDKPTLYRCHLNVWDMAYPIKVDDVLLGVLFAGQIVVKKGTVEWKKVLKGITDNPDYQVFWNPLDEGVKISESSDHIEDIEGAIRREADVTNQDKLIKIAERDPEEKNSEPKEIVSRFEDFIKFGDMLTELLNELYAARKDAAIRQLMQATATYLARADLPSRQKWHEHCKALFLLFCTLSNIKKIHIYSRIHSYYERTVPFEEGKRCRIKSRDILQAGFPEKMTKLNNENTKEKLILAKLGVGTENVWLFRTENKAGSNMPVGFMVINGKVSEQNKKLIEFFCETMCRCNDIASLVFWLKKQQDGFKLRVGEVAHSFGTPLQSLLFDIDNVQRYINDNQNLIALLNESKRRLFGAKEDVIRLIKEIKNRREECNLIPLVNEAMDILNPIANNHPCKLIKRGEWPQEAIVRIDKWRIRHAITALFDNAIKYSWRGKNEDGIVELHEVRIWIEVIDGEMVMIRVSNYGIGIPPDRLESIRELWERGEVPDKRYLRSGTGLGLPIATNAFEEHGGWIDIASDPADDDPRKPEEQYHRYVTEVKANLPVYK